MASVKGVLLNLSLICTFAPIFKRWRTIVMSPSQQAICRAVRPSAFVCEISAPYSLSNGINKYLLSAIVSLVKLLLFFRASYYVTFISYSTGKSLSSRFYQAIDKKKEEINETYVSLERI
jgi:hypothetical protein